VLRTATCSGYSFTDCANKARIVGSFSIVRDVRSFIPSTVSPPVVRRQAVGSRSEWRPDDGLRIVSRKEATVNETVREALDFAIAKEREAEAFYKEWAAKVENPAVVALFAELAGVEHGHIEMLSRITPEDLVEATSVGEADLKLSERLVDVKASKGMGIQEAMILAMKREEAAAALYDELAGLGGDARSLFEGLAKEERRHKRRLEADYDEQVLTEN